MSNNTGNIDREKRRRISKSLLDTKNKSEFVEKNENYLRLQEVVIIEEDATNRELFLEYNTEITGLAFEYNFLTGKYHPQIEESYYTYIKPIYDKNGIIKSFEEDKIIDCEKLRVAARLEEDNEFFDELNEDDIFPSDEKLQKYSIWTNDEDENVLDYEPSELDLYNMIIELKKWYDFGEYLHLKIEHCIDCGGTGCEECDFEETVDIKEYFTIKSPYVEYFNDGRSETFIQIENEENINIEPGEFVLIYNNSQNFAFGKIENVGIFNDEILFTPDCRKGQINEGDKIYYFFEPNDNRLLEVMYEIFMNIKSKYEEILFYLNRNINKTLSNNSEEIELLNNYISIINNIGKNGDSNYFKDQAESILTTRIGEIESRSSFIMSYLLSNSEYVNKTLQKRNDILKERINKKNGTLSLLVKNEHNLNYLFGLLRQEQIVDYSDYLIAKLCLIEGDNKNRVWVENSEGIEKGDTVYIISDDENLPEIKCEVDFIVDGYLPDYENSKYNYEILHHINKHKPAKRIYLKNMDINGRVWPKRKIPPSYELSNFFRIVKIQDNYLGYAILIGGDAFTTDENLTDFYYGGKAFFENDPLLGRDFEVKIELIGV